MNDHDGLGAGADPPLEVLRVERQRRVHLGDHGHRPAHDHRTWAGQKGERGQDHLIARSRLQGGQPHDQGRRAGGHPEGVAGAHPPGEVLLERPDLAQNPRPVVAEGALGPQHLGGGLDFLLAEDPRPGPRRGKGFGPGRPAAVNRHLGAVGVAGRPLAWGMRIHVLHLLAPTRPPDGASLQWFTNAVEPEDP